MDASRLRYLFPEGVRELPADLAVILALVLATNVVVWLPLVSDSIVRHLLGLSIVLFVPGFVLLAILVPEGPTGSGDSTDVTDGRLVLLERLALSIGLSAALVPLIAVIIEFSPFAIRLRTVLLALSITAVAGIAIATRRRRALPPAERFRLPYRQWLAVVREDVVAPSTRVDLLLNVLIAVGVVLAVGAVGYTTLTPNEGTAHTELYLLTEEDGSPTASGYPANLTLGQESSVLLGVGNREHRPMNYTVVVALQRVRMGTNSTEVVDSRELERFTTRVEKNQSVQRTVTFTPTMRGERLRLAFLLYVGDPPDEPTLDNAYRETHLYVSSNATGV